MSKKKVIAVRNLKNWTKFTTHNNEKENQFFLSKNWFSCHGWGVWLRRNSPWISSKTARTFLSSVIENLKNSVPVDTWYHHSLDWLLFVDTTTVPRRCVVIKLFPGLVSYPFQPDNCPVDFRMSQLRFAKSLLGSSWHVSNQCVGPRGTRLHF